MAYRRVYSKQARLAEVPSDEEKAAHTGYLESVNYFLECVEISSLLDNDLETIYAYMRDVIADLTHTLMRVFAENKIQTAIEAEWLRHVIWEVNNLDDCRVEACITNTLVPDILHLATMLETASGYDDECWMDEIQWCARVFKETIARVKCKSTTA